MTDEGKELVLHIKPKSEDGSKECQALLDAVRSSSDAPVLGTLKDKHEGKFYPVWQAALEASGIATADVSAGVADLLSIKDAAEVMNVKKASFLAAKVRSRGSGRCGLCMQQQAHRHQRRAAGGMGMGSSARSSRGTGSRARPHAAAGLTASPRVEARAAVHRS